MESNENIVTIVGGGIAGLSLALALHRLGLKSLVLETSDSLRVTGAAFCTWPNAWKALDCLGVADSLRQQHFKLSRVVTSSIISGVATAQLPFGEEEVRCVKRLTLVETLAKELPNDAIRFSSKVVSIQNSGFFKLIHLADGSIFKTKVLIGCDGVNSRVGRWLGFNSPTFSNRSAIRGHVCLKVNHGLNPEFLQFTGNGFRFGLFPCDSTSIYWFFIFYPSNKDKEVKETPWKMKEFVVNNLGKVPNQVKEVISKTEVKDIIYSQLSYRPPWELLWGNISKDNVCVVGDAFHPMTPDIGQGACSSLEDSMILSRCLFEAFSLKKDENEEVQFKKIEGSLKKYVEIRKWRAIDLVFTAFIVGVLQQIDGKIMSFLRDNFMAPFFAWLMLKKTKYDCGSLKI